jgi:hypothetical protein
MASCGGSVDNRDKPVAGGGESSVSGPGDPSGGAAPAGAGGSRGGAGPGGAPSEGGAPRAGAAGATSGGDAGEAGAPNDTELPYVAKNACTGEPVTLDEALLRWCVVTSACTGTEVVWCLNDVGTNVVMDFSSFTGAPPFKAQRPPIGLAGVATCAADVASCDDVLACAGFKRAEAECATSKATRCEGDIGIFCGNIARPEPSVVDCVRMTGKAGTCRVVGSGDAARALCVVDDSCPGPDGSTWCQGDMLRRCNGGRSDGIDCAAFNLDCVQISAGYAECAPPLPQTICNQPGTPYCDGDKPAYCNPDGLLFELPSCSVAGQLTCDDTLGMDDMGVGCYPKGCAAEPEDPGFGHCEGDDYVFNGELHLRVHCPSYGFATCRDNVCAN